MKTNVSIELTDDERNHLNNIYHNTKNKNLITRKDLVNLINLMVQELLKEDVGSYREVVNNIAEEGYRYYFNSTRVSPKEFEEGIENWLKGRALQK